MSKRTKKNRRKNGDKRTKITITKIEIIQMGRNPIHYDHITGGIKGGAFGGSKRDLRRKARREAKKDGSDE